MKKKIKKESKILSENEVKIVTRTFKEIIGSKILHKAQEYRINIEDTIRFYAVINQIKERRESKDLTIKEVSTQLKVPQYKLKEIEKGIIKNIKLEILNKYVDYLELTEWFTKWLEVNPKLKIKLIKQSNMRFNATGKAGGFLNV